MNNTKPFLCIFPSLPSLLVVKIEAVPVQPSWFVLQCHLGLIVKILPYRQLPSNYPNFPLSRMQLQATGRVAVSCTAWLVSPCGHRVLFSVKPQSWSQLQRLPGEMESSGTVYKYPLELPGITFQQGRGTSRAQPGPFPLLPAYTCIPNSVGRCKEGETGTL